MVGKLGWFGRLFRRRPLTPEEVERRAREDRRDVRAQEAARQFRGRAGKGL